MQPEDGELTIEDKAAGMGSVFKRDDTRLAAMREQDEREKVPLALPTFPPTPEMSYILVLLLPFWK